MTGDAVPPQVAQARFERLAALQGGISLERNQEQVGRVLEVLTEGPSRKDPEIAATRARSGKLVHVEGRVDAGRFLDVAVMRAAPHHLVGRRVA